MRIISGGIQHETNTFAVGMTTVDDFIRDSALGPDLSGGDAILERFTGTETIHGGYIAGAKECGFELAPVLNIRAYPSGMVAQESFESLTKLLLDRIEAALPCDGVLLDLHGAMVCEDYEDAEAEIVRRVKNLVDDTPVVVTLDLHANISPALADRADVIIGYDTYPHVDMGARGNEAARLIHRMVLGEVQPRQAYRQLPLLTVPPMQCTLREPMQSVIQELHALESQSGMLTATIAMGFPFADIHDMGVSVVAVSDGDQQLAEKIADQIADRLWKLRAELQPKLTTIEDAIRAVESTDGMIIFADGSDNPGGGAPCDGTVALEAMIKADVQGGLVALIFDPETVEAATAAGIGNAFEAAIGAKTDDRHGKTVHVTAKVLALSDGRFRFQGEMAKGLEETIGQAALVEVGGVKVVVNSIRRQLIDRAMLETVGVDLTSIRLFVIKSAVHFRADLGPLASVIFDADTPGVHRPDFATFAYRNVRRPTYPLDELASR